MGAAGWRSCVPFRSCFLQVRWCHTLSPCHLAYPCGGGGHYPLPGSQQVPHSPRKHHTVRQILSYPLHFLNFIYLYFLKPLANFNEFLNPVKIFVLIFYSPCSCCCLT